MSWVAVAAGAGTAIGGASGGKKASKGNKASNLQAQLAHRLFQETDPLRLDLIERSTDFLGGGADVRDTPAFEALKLTADTGFNQAKDNIIARTAPGGALTSALTELEGTRAGALTQGAGALYGDELSRAMQLGTGTTSQSLNSLGQAGAIQGQMAAAQAEQNAGKMGAVGTGLGAYMGGKPSKPATSGGKGGVIMSLGHLAGGFMQAFAAARDRKEMKELTEKEIKARATIHEIELRKAQREEAEQLKREESRKQLFAMMGGSAPVQSSAPQDGIGPVPGPKPAMSLTEMLADPKAAALILQSGVGNLGDLVKAPIQEPDAVRTLRALSADPALMAAEIQRRQAGAANTTVNLDAMGLPKPPSGYFRPDPKKPGLELEPGGPTEREIAVTSSEALKSVETSEAALDKLAAAATALKDNKSLWRATGLAGAVPNVPGSAAADIEADLTSLQSQVAFGVLQAMREASKTGGALGAVSERELDLLQNNLASLDRKKSPEAFKAALQKIIDYTTDAKRRIRDAHKRTYGGVIDESGAAGGAGAKLTYDPATGTFK